MTDIYHYVSSFLSSIPWTAVTAIFGGLWAIWTFARSNRTKAAEILIDIEKAYGTHIPTLLAIESVETYDGRFKNALAIELGWKTGTKSSQERRDLKKLESALRHFFVCGNVRRLSVDAGSINHLCAWYLYVMVMDKAEGARVVKRPELRAYIRRFWPSVYFWAALAYQPLPKRMLVYLSQVPERINYWWTGSFAKPRD